MSTKARSQPGPIVYMLEPVHLLYPSEARLTVRPFPIIIAAPGLAHTI